ncbi:hypothetical protein PDL71_10375 [Lacibacter sp. MH-610]|uniref:hypothetical protein n=1 Tax=Lacibacter sp. MH-610 TaxID=3020883 RepID=UPI0038927D8E
MAAPLSVSIVHPQAVHLKKISPLLHFIAGLLFLTAAYYEFIADNRITAFCEAVIAADVLAIAFMKRFAEESTRINAWFRLIEAVVFSGIAILTLLNHDYLISGFSIVAAGLYAYVFHCENKLISRERVDVHHLGVTISSFPNDKYIDWVDIVSIKALPHSITITTFKKKTYHFEFEKGIALSELEQIHDFCSYYLNTGS